MGLLLVTTWTGLASAEPPASRPPPDGTASGSRPSICGNITPQPLHGYKVPGRKPGSQMPWKLFLGNASHRLIAYIYGVRYPTNAVFYNNTSIKHILDKSGIGDSSLLPKMEQELRPDITDISARDVFEIKLHGEQGLQEGAQKFRHTCSH